MNDYRVGFAVADITPPVGTPIGGHFRSDPASRGVYMPLLAQAMVVQNGATTVAIVSADLLMVTKTMVASIRRAVFEKCGLPEENILVAAIHTHGGPPTSELIEGCMASDEVITRITHLITGTILEALDGARPAEIKIARFEEPRLVFNRRIRMKDGSTRMNWEPLEPAEIDAPLGPVDPEGFVIAVHSDNRLSGMLVNYALHPAVLAGDNYSMGPDWPGYLREALIQHVGDTIPILYTNGAQGNINHVNAKEPGRMHGFDEAERIGYTLADTVTSVLHTSTDVTGPVAVSNEILTIPRYPVDPGALAAARERLEAFEELTIEGQQNGMPPWFFDRELIEHAARQSEPVELEVQTIRIGNIGLAGLPGEFFVEWGLQLKAQSPTAFTLPIGLANDSVGYVPTPAAMEQGGYEGTIWRYNQLESNAGEKVVDSAVRQLQVLFDKSI
ncbi:MAG: neutral/alkaline non-lysosomal ceramidase N-terminal domain-containing protein [bacterium]